MKARIIMALDYPVRYCPKCGKIALTSMRPNEKCLYCGTSLQDTEYIVDDVTERGCLKKEVKTAIFEKYIKDNPMYSEEAVKNREEQERHNRLNMPSSYKPKESNKPKCPTCGSINIQKISTGKKAIGFVAVGVFSSNFGKTMECKNCGYKW